MYKILSYIALYNQGSAVLTVAIECNIEGNWKAYQGVILYAMDEVTEENIQHIAARGQKLSKRLACAYFPNLKSEACECPDIN
jgi:hypothetical protein